MFLEDTPNPAGRGSSDNGIEGTSFVLAFASFVLASHGFVLFARFGSGLPVTLCLDVTGHFAVCRRNDDKIFQSCRRGDAFRCQAQLSCSFSATSLLDDRYSALDRAARRYNFLTAGNDRLRDVPCELIACFGLFAAQAGA